MSKKTEVQNHTHNVQSRVFPTCRRHCWECFLLVHSPSHHHLTQGTFADFVTLLHFSFPAFSTACARHTAINDGVLLVHHPPTHPRKPSEATARCSCDLFLALSLYSLVFAHQRGQSRIVMLQSSFSFLSTFKLFSVAKPHQQPLPPLIFRPLLLRALIQFHRPRTRPIHTSMH